MAELISRALFPVFERATYLDTAAEGLVPSSTAGAFARYLEAKSTGSFGRAELYAQEARVTATVARLLGTDPENVALLSSASEGLNALADSIDWRPGDEVLVTDLEFPSNIVVWLKLKDRGVKLRVVPSREGRVSLEDFTSRLTPATRVVSVSFVSYKSGTRIPFLRELGAAAHANGSLFCVDATQGLGRVPLAVDGIDFLVSSSYKWLMGPHGAGIVYAAPAVREWLRPPAVGWYGIARLFYPERFTSYEFKPGARCLQPGMPNFPVLYALDHGIGLVLEAGVERIENELRPLVEAMREGLVDLGLQLLTPPEREFGSGIVAFEHAQAEQIGAAVRNQGIAVWSGDGRVRAAIHVYNHASDVEKYHAILGRILKELRE